MGVYARDQLQLPLAYNGPPPCNKLKKKLPPSRPSTEGIAAAMVSPPTLRAARLEALAPSMLAELSLPFAFPCLLPRIPARCAARCDPDPSVFGLHGVLTRAERYQPCTMCRTLCSADPSVFGLHGVPARLSDISPARCAARCAPPTRAFFGLQAERYQPCTACRTLCCADPSVSGGQISPARRAARCAPPTRASRAARRAFLLG